RDGTVLASGELAVGALRGGEDGLLFLLLVAWSVVISAMVLVLPQNRKLRIIVPPDGFVLAEPARRMLASVIDLLPGMILVSLVWQKPVEWWLSPLSEIVSSDGSMPIFTLAWATFGYLAIADGVWGRTLGKLLVGCRTVTDDGGSPGLRRGAARSFLKVFCPPLVVVLLLMPYAPAPWSFGTVVVRKSGDSGSGSDQDA
ncbi:MAG: RDD family protein, partial [bacterium]|nr:RDD family protein [bacterium]